MTNRRLLLFMVLLGCSRTPENERMSVPDTAPQAPEAPINAPPVDSGAPRLLPVDEADSSFRAFRARTLAALARRDTTYLYGLLAPAIKNSFGGDDSIAGFKRIWKMDQPDSEVWTALARVLNMGGKRADSTFIAPYVYWFWPDSIDAFEHIAVTREHAPVYAAPAANAKVIGTASHSILKVEEWKAMTEAFAPTDTSWVRVRLPDRSEAWLKANDVYSPVGWRAFFERKAPDRWIMTLLVAGD